MNPEEEARQVIDRDLSNSGWIDIDESAGNTGYKTEYPTSSGPVDYVLFIDNEPIAVVEAKEASKDAYSALTQARRYARSIETGESYGGEYGVPFAFTANSEEVWFQDLRPEAPKERKLRSFHTPDGLQKFMDTDYEGAKEWLADTPIEETDDELWNNQHEAIENIEGAIQENKRRILVQMATGTGKTRMACAQTYRLLKSGYINNALFLVDRTSLAKQTVSEFKNYDVGGIRLGDIYSIERADGYVPENADIVVGTLQGMYSYLEKRDEIDVPQHAFDFVISDECHRSIYNDWKVVLSHFDALQLGLTATPAEHTVGYFRENWVYRYRYWDAVEDGKVVPYETYRIDTEITMDGLVYDGEEYDPKELERKITVPATNRLIAREFRENSEDDEKTLVFAKNDYHAKELERIFRQVYSDKEDRYVKKITYTTDRPQNWIKRFRNKEYPKIAVTVDMISTGVDVRPIENIIFARPTQSPVLYNQMIGRGTRKCDRIDKEKFTIYDCIGIVDYFDETPPFNTYRPQSEDGEESGGDGGGGGGGDEMIVADDVTDELEYSGYVFTTDDGEELRPDDYVTAFEEYVQDKGSEIEALRVIMDSPGDLSREHLRELREKLHEQPEGFTEEKLQKAYNEEMADIIGFVKHALGEDDFLTTEERVESAFEAWLQDKDESFTESERAWLDLIKKHYMQEMDIREEDFYYPPFSTEGGWNVAAEAFGGEEELRSILNELNEEVVHG
jgi:type I restriction enzyme R subunit